MSDWRNYSNARQMIDWSRVQSFDDDCTLLLLPTNIWRIARLFLETRATWRTTYYVSFETEQYELPTESEFVEWLDIYHEELAGAEMSCNSEFMATMNGILAALQQSAMNQAACCQGAATFVSDGEGGYYYGTQDPGQPPETFGGEGEFEDEADFSNHRCLFANNLVSGLIVTSNNMSILTTASVFAGTLVVTIFVASPPAALLLALLLADFANEAFEDIAELLEENRQELVCAIHDASGLAGIIAGIDEILTGIFTALGLGAFEDALLELYHSMLTTDTLNQIYTVMDLPPVSGYANCDECAGMPDLPMLVVHQDGCDNTWGSVIRDGDNYEFTSSVIDFGCGSEDFQHGVAFTAVPDATPFRITGFASSLASGNIRYWSVDGSPTAYYSIGVPSDSVDFDGLVFMRDDEALTEFWVSFTVDWI